MKVKSWFYLFLWIIGFFVSVGLLAVFTHFLSFPPEVTSILGMLVGAPFGVKAAIAVAKKMDYI